MEVGLFGPKVEAEKDENLNQSLLLNLRNPDFYKNHEIRFTLLQLR
jgi:hypothetical protein